MGVVQVAIRLAMGWRCRIVYHPDLESVSLVTPPKAGRLGLRVMSYG